MDSIPIGDRPLGNVVPLSGAGMASTPTGEPELEPDELEPDEPEPDEPEPDEPEAIGPEPSAAQLARMAEESLRIGVGFASAVATALSRAFDSMTREPSVEGEPAPAGPSVVALATGAAAGMTLELALAAIKAAEAAGTTARPMLSWFSLPKALHGPAATFEDKATDMNDKWSRARQPGERAAGAFARELIPEVANALLDQIDLTQLVVDRVDVSRIVDSVDMGHVIDQIPIDQIIQKVDLNAIVERIDIEAIVQRIDLNQIAASIDLDAIVDRIDVVGIAQEVITEIDLPQLVRASSGTMATETVEGIRVQTMDADRLLERVIDRMLQRKKERRTDVAEASPEPPVPSL